MLYILLITNAVTLSKIKSITFRVELVHRESSVPYFAGSGGVTSPTGYTTTPLPSDWKPDLVKMENRIVFAILFRI